MTPLDQAFIRAYMQQGTASATTPPESVRPGVPRDPPHGQPTQEPPDADSERSVSGEPSHPDEVCGTTETTLPPSVRAGSIDTGADQGDADATIDRPGPACVAHRLDPGTSAKPTAGAEGQTVPAPHVGTAIPAAGQHASGPEDVDAFADRAVPADADFPAAEATAVDGSFQPMLQVDRYRWPKVCRQLTEEAAPEVDRLADGLVAAMARGHKVLAIGGCQSGEGATTLVLCAGQCLAERGHKVVMVDANPADPKLGKRLGLVPQFGWEDVLAGRLPLEEVVIESTHNRLAVLPLSGSFAGTGGPAEDETRLADGIRTLAAHYDLVLVDLEPLGNLDGVGSSLVRGVAGQLDAIVLVQNVGTTTPDHLAEVQRCLAASDVAQPGIIQNFVRA